MRTLVACCTLLWLAAVAHAATVAGKEFKETETIAGKTLKLIGAGLREKWFVDVYAFAAWTESGACDPQAIITTDEVKMLRLEMLRNVDAEKMGSTIGDSFDKAMPQNASAELKAQRQTFQGYFKDEAKKGQRIQFVYEPGVGVTAIQNGKPMGPPLAGKAFQEVLWGIYFGERTCCSDMKEQVLEGCKR